MPPEPGAAAGKPARVCYIHVGTHKTGTTSIQCFLSGNRERFHARGVYFPLAGCGDDATVAHHQLANELLQRPTFRPERGGLDAIVAELGRSAATTAALTSEDLALLYNKPKTLARLRDAIRGAGFAPRIVIYVRPQASYLTAVYAENVRHGYRTSFAQYLSTIVDRGHYYWNDLPGLPLDYRVLVDAFAAIFGRMSTIVRVYRRNVPAHVLMHSFAKLIVPAGIDHRGFDVPLIRHNPSLNFAGVLRHLGLENDLDESVPFRPLSLTDTARIARRFARPNAILAMKYRVLVPMFEPADIAAASPLPRMRRETQTLARARGALHSLDC